MICVAMLRPTIFVAEHLVRRLLITRSIVTNPKGTIPYGSSKWDQIRQNKFVYIDKTETIAKMDSEPVHSCLWSPRRTGKSLLVNQLALWHDKAIKDDEVLAYSF
jgi:hypothetical protein